MKICKEIRLENFSDIEKVVQEVKVKSIEKNGYYETRIILVGIDTIKKFQQTYNVQIPDYSWGWANESTKNLKIHGSAKLVHICCISIYADCGEFKEEKYKTPCFSDTHLTRVVEYKNHLLTTGCSNGDKTYRFYLFNEIIDTRFIETKYPQRVGTLTDKKADAWLNCLLDEKKRAIENDNANIENIKKFKNMLADLLKMPLSRFEENHNVFRMGIFKITYQCDSKTGHTRVDVGFDTCARSADNKTYLTNVDRIKILADAGLLK